MVQWVAGSILHGVDQLSYFSFQPFLHDDWCNKSCGMYYPVCGMEGRKEMCYLRTHSTHLRLYDVRHMVKDHTEREETRFRHMGYSFRLTARVLLYAPSHRQDSTYHILCYTSRVALAGTRNSSMGPPHEGSIRRPIAPRVNALTTELHLAPCGMVHIKEPLLLIKKSSPCGGSRFPLYLNSPLPYV